MSVTPDEIQKATKRIEEEKAEKQRLRLEKKEAKEKRIQDEKRERLVGPFLLFITLIISALVMMVSR